MNLQQDERRARALNIMIRPSLRAAIDEDRKAKGQSITEWIERAAMAHLLSSSAAKKKWHGSERS
jgi:hypothetical protein